ncbi:MAG: hypothetical protein V4576_04445 [Patescibacteria group bacterium]
MNKSSLKDSLVKTYHDVEEVLEQELYDAWHIRWHKHLKRRVHTLSQRPDHHKDAIAFSLAFLFTLLVFIGWYFISFPRIIDSYKINRKENSALNGSRNPIDTIKNQVYNNNIQTE